MRQNHMVRPFADDGAEMMSDLEEYEAQIADEINREIEDIARAQEELLNQWRMCDD